jgi:hypothetical protein
MIAETSPVYYDGFKGRLGFHRDNQNYTYSPIEIASTHIMQRQKQYGNLRCSILTNIDERQYHLYASKKQFQRGGTSAHRQSRKVAIMPAN